MRIGQGACAADAERMMIFRVLLGVLAEPPVDGPSTAPVLRRICRTLVQEVPAIRFAAYVILDDGQDDVLPEFSAGIAPTALRITRSNAGVLEEVLRDRAPRVRMRTKGSPEAWLRALPEDVAEVVLFPFGVAAIHGVGLVGASTRQYFRRVGLDYFAAFAHLGDLALSLRTLALRDPLTALPNRTLFLDRLRQAASHARRQERLLGVALLDLDGLKPINDQFGHAAGDEVLRQVSGALQEVLRPADTLARIGGDEFGLLLTDALRVDDLEALCERLLAVLRSRPLAIGEDQTVRVSASLGLTVFPLDDGDEERLMRHADLALYAAKTAGRDRYRIHSRELDEARRRDIVTRDLVKHALAEGRMVVHYQPIVAIDGPVVGLEALVRLRHEERGLLFPEAFATALDSLGLARSIGCFVLETVAAQAETWGREIGWGNAWRFSVNISARHLLHPLFLEDLRATLRRHPGLAPSALEIEITESAPLRDLPVVERTLRACLDLGVRTALDDFGTGSASFTHLQKLPVHTLKIDQGFVRNMAQDAKDLAIVSGVTHIANLLGLDVIAEGAETHEHVRLLKGLGCAHVQGFAISEALPAAQIPDWFAAHNRRAAFPESA